MKKWSLALLMGLVAATSLSCDDEDVLKKFSTASYCQTFEDCGGYRKWGFKDQAECVQTVDNQLAVFERCKEYMQDVLLCRSKLTCEDFEDTSLQAMRYDCPDAYDMSVLCGEDEYPDKGNILEFDYSKVECNSNEKPSCEGNSVKTCDGGEYKYENCGNQATCENGACKEKQKECTENEKKCKNDTVLSVCHNNTWIDSTCPSNYTCQNNQCSTPAGACVENDAYCLGDTSVNICHGGNWTSSLCPPGTKCLNGQCKDTGSISDKECTGYDKFCDGNGRVKFCNGDHYEYLNCASDEICNNGECQKQQTSKCEPYEEWVNLVPGHCENFVVPACKKLDEALNKAFGSETTLWCSVECDTLIYSQSGISKDEVFNQMVGTKYHKMSGSYSQDECISNFVKGVKDSKYGEKYAKIIKCLNQSSVSVSTLANLGVMNYCQGYGQCKTVSHPCAVEIADYETSH